MGHHYYHGGAEPELLTSLAEHSDHDAEVTDDAISEIVDVANEHGYVITALMLEDAPRFTEDTDD